MLYERKTYQIVQLNNKFLFLQSKLQDVTSSNVHVILKCFLRQVNLNYEGTVLSYFFLALKERKSGENNNSDFEILLNFELPAAAMKLQRSKSR